MKAFLFTVILAASTSYPLKSLGQDSLYLQRLGQLKSAIQKVLQDTKTPGLGVALVTKEGSIWIDGLGHANIAKKIKADSNTMFRVASISKMFVALSILKLQEEGRLTLDDEVREIAPEIAFENPWEETNPVRVVHLLEHTTGWDDYHLVEQTDVPLTLKEALDLHPHSRKSRWIPGSRMAYANSGFAVAGYIVEKVSQVKFEKYVLQNFFRPLGMTRSTFFNDEKQKRFGTMLYDEARDTLEYLHVLHRPAGAMHSSAADMGRFIRFLLNRGRAGTWQLLSAASISRMEVTKSTPGASAGLEMGFGLANFRTSHNGYTYQGHSGSMPGALAELAYLPQHGIGHAFFINAANGAAYTRIAKLIRDFETQPVGVRPHDNFTTADFTFRNGYYYPINPRLQAGYFFDRIADIYRFEKTDSVLTQSWIFAGAKTIFIPISDSTFHLRDTRSVSLVKALDPVEGEVLHTDSRVYKQVPAWLVFLQLSIVVLWIVMMVLGTIIFVFALGRYWAGNSADALRITLYPTVATLMFIVVASAVIFLPRYFNENMITPGALSIGLMAASVWYALSAISSVCMLFRSRTVNTGKTTFWSMAVLSCLHLIVVLYLLWFDVIPVVTWA